MEQDFNALAPSDRTVRCDVGLPNGSYRFVRFEPYAPALRRVAIEGGVLTALTDVGAGEGDLSDATGLVARIAWTEGEPEGQCTVVAVPRDLVTGTVVDGASVPVAGVLVSACGVSETTAGNGAFSLTLPHGKLCQLRAVLGSKAGARRTAKEVVAPQQVTVVLPEPVPLAEVVQELTSVSDRLGQLITVQEQLLATLPDAGPDAVMVLERHMRQRERLNEVREGGDPEALLEAWATLE